MIYIYPAIFEKENKFYNVSFPDLRGCFTFGIGEADAYLMAAEASFLWLGLDSDDQIEEVPKPTPIEDIPVPENGFVSLVMAACFESTDPESRKNDSESLMEDEDDFEIPEGTANAILKFCGLEEQDDGRSKY